jgi:endonuclease-8
MFPLCMTVALNLKRLWRRGKPSEAPAVFGAGIDIMNPAWNGDPVYHLIRDSGGLIGDILLDQTVFAGVGNIIQNEALARAGVHPLRMTASIPAPVLKGLIEETRAFSLLLYREKKEGRDVRDSCVVYGRRRCPSGEKMTRANMGESNRLTYVCEDSLVLYRP